MISLRHFEESDVEVLQTYNLSGKSKDDIISMIHDWNMLSYKGHYFEMFAIQNDATVVGSISIYGRSRSIVSLARIFHEKCLKKWRILYKVLYYNSLQNNITYKTRHDKMYISIDSFSRKAEQENHA